MENPRTHLVTGDVPFEFVEAYKALRTNFNFVTHTSNCRTILITSAMPNEGKTSVVINLAISLVQTGKRVLVLDGDLRNPTLHRYLNLRREAGRGLTAILAGSANMEDCVVATQLGFDVIPGGTTPPNPVELLTSKEMTQLLAAGQEKYDFIICDAPPVGLVTDAAAMSGMCDGVLFVVRQKMAKKNHVIGAVHKLKSVNARILGVIFNQYDMTDLPEKDYSYYSSYGR